MCLLNLWFDSSFVSSDLCSQVCKDECEMLQTNVCQLEYTLAKKHSSIAQANILPSCDNLPAIESHQSNQCIRLGVPNAIHVTSGMIALFELR